VKSFSHFNQKTLLFLPPPAPLPFPLRISNSLFKNYSAFPSTVSPISCKNMPITRPVFSRISRLYGTCLGTILHLRSIAPTIVSSMGLCDPELLRAPQRLTYGTRTPIFWVCFFCLNEALPRRLSFICRALLMVISFMSPPRSPQFFVGHLPRSRRCPLTFVFSIFHFICFFFF